jgi:hypothetical protein
VVEGSGAGEVDKASNTMDLSKHKWRNQGAATVRGRE